jgi:hypothetical protein
MGRLMLRSNGDALALGSLAAVLLMSAVLALALQPTKALKAR